MSDVGGDAEPTPMSPCRRVCVVGADGLCDGCGRTLEEIARWVAMPDQRRLEVMERVRCWTARAPGRDLGRGPG